MDTLPTDLLALSSAFLSSIEQESFSLFFKCIPEPRACNNLLEAVSTDNWGYINNIPRHFLGPNSLLVYSINTIRIMLAQAEKYLNGVKLDPNYGPPLSLLDCLPFSYYLSPHNNMGSFDLDFHLKRCRETFREAKQPIVLPLVEHTPKVMYVYKGREEWRYEPVVGSICSMTENGFGDGSSSSWVVTDVIRTKTKEKKIKEIRIAMITFINSTTVVYDDNTPKMTCKFYQKDGGWSNPDYRNFWSLQFDNFVFYDPGFIK